jgi:hypothetical protein
MSQCVSLTVQDHMSNPHATQGRISLTEDSRHAKAPTPCNYSAYCAIDAILSRPPSRNHAGSPALGGQTGGEASGARHQVLVVRDKARQRKKRHDLGPRAKALGLSSLDASVNSIHSTNSDLVTFAQRSGGKLPRMTLAQRYGQMDSPQSGRWHLDLDIPTCRIWNESTEVRPVTATRVRAHSCNHILIKVVRASVYS